ncbi:MAG: DUF3987 domain-containing protein [Prevotella sp.]|nr:DUF3987 domain-containing protein [Prevotella sp.]
MSFGIALSVRSRVRECTPALFNQVVDSEQTARVCAEIEDALERVKRGEMSREDFETYKAEQKKRLAIFTPHAMFPKGRRVNEDAVPSGLSMYDVDHIEPTPSPLTREGSIYQRLVEHTLAKRAITDEEMIAELKRLGICLVHVTPSTEGFRLFFVMPEGMSLEEAQRWMSEQLGDSQYDGCVKDMARCSFAVPRNYILYLDEEELWEPHPQQTYPPSSTKNALSLSTKNNPLSSPAEDTIATKAIETPSGAVGGAVGAFRGIPYSSIIREWWLRTGGEPQEGERNVKLHKLAVNLRAICDNRREVLMAVMPRFGLSEEELKNIVDSACKDEPKSVSRLMKGIIDALGRDISADEMDDVEAATEDSPAFEHPLLQKGMRSFLPLGLKESLVGVPASMYMPVLCSVLPIAAAYADQVEVVYCDGMRQRLGLMSIIRGEQASGKSVCKQAVDVWKRQFDEEDALARRREEEWKERKKSRKANEKAPDDPKVLIRMVPVTVSCSTLLKRFKNANGHCLYSFGEELDTLRKTNGAGSWSSKYDIYRLGFDNGEWGQDYNSDQAESGVVRVAYNWTMLGTDGALRKCFKADNIENGLSSRVLVAEMPDSSFAKMPKFGQRSAEDEARIQEAVTRLRSYSGFVDTPRLRKGIEKWVEQKRVEAAKDIDRVKDVYRKRAAVIGFRCGVVFHLLSGYTRETKACLDFALMMADYTLQQQIAAFGEALEGQFVDAHSECQRYGSNHSVYDQLPPTFSMGDLRALKRGFCGESALRKIISRWYRDHWIEKTDRMHWKKLNAEK